MELSEGLLLINVLPTLGVADFHCEELNLVEIPNTIVSYSWTPYFGTSFLSVKGGSRCEPLSTRSFNCEELDLVEGPQTPVAYSSTTHFGISFQQGRSTGWYFGRVRPIMIRGMTSVLLPGMTIWVKSCRQ